MANSRRLNILLILVSLLASGNGHADGLTDDYLLLEPGFTNIGEMDLKQEVWVGPLVFPAVDEFTEIIGLRTSSPDLTVLEDPKTIEMGAECEILVAFTPRATGLQTLKVILETSVGEMQAIVRAMVISEDPLRVLGMAWPVTVTPDNVIGAGELLEEVRERPNDWTRILIDLRSKMRFEQKHVLGAKWMSLHELRFRQDLKNHDIFLIDDGLYRQSSLIEAKRLAQSGFESVRWVEGGLPGWIQAGGDLAANPARSSGSVYGDETWRAMSPVDLYFSGARSQMSVVVLGDDLEWKQTKALFPNHRHYRWEDGKTIDQINQEMSPNDPILILGGDPQAFINLVNDLGVLGYHRVYTLEGGLSAMMKYLESKQLKDPNLRTYSVRAGARNPKGKLPPKLKSNSDCLTCD